MYWVIQYFASGLQNYGLAYVQWTYLQNNRRHLPYMAHAGNFTKIRCYVAKLKIVTSFSGSSTAA